MSLSFLHNSFPTLTTCCFRKISFNVIFLFYARDSGGEPKGHFVMKANERQNDSAAHCSCHSFIVSAMPATCSTAHISCFLLPAAHMSEIPIILLFGVKHHITENYLRFVYVCYVGCLRFDSCSWDVRFITRATLSCCSCQHHH
jgi:hypothetical protein